MQVPSWISRSVMEALNEDIGAGDCSASLIPQQQSAYATIVCRESAIMCGQDWLNEVFHQLDPSTQIQWHVTEGQQVHADQVLCTLSGLSHILLSGERTALNFLQTLMGTATTTATYVRALGDSKTKLLDTRKTIPGLRQAQKYATRVGGALNHRMGLYDAIMLKENHIMAAGSISGAVMHAKQCYPHTFIEVEVENLDELAQALQQPVDRIMLDNFSVDQIRTAVSMTNGKIPLEVSGNIDLHNIASYAALGVDYISTGAITKHIHAIDLSMRFTESH